MLRINARSNERDVISFQDETPMNPDTVSTAHKKFMKSMQITQDEWRDGIGFDLDALREVTDSERDSLTLILAQQLTDHGDWRHMEALAAIGTTAATDAIRESLKSKNMETRLHAAKFLAEIGEPADLEDTIIATLRGTDLSSGLSQAIDLAEQHPSPRLQETLLDLALNGTEEQRIHCAALALFHGGKADEAFDWNHRPFFLQFGDEDRQVQIEAYKELCERLGIAPKLPHEKP